MKNLKQSSLKIANVIALTLMLVVAIDSQSLANESGANRPNIILINVDDADADLFSAAMLQSHYPNMRNLAQSGIRFTNLHATTPFCAPSRAALFRGQYAFSTGVKVNEPTTDTSNGFTGGYEEFVNRGHDTDELGVWMRNAGYRTMHVGKFHHHNFDNRVPPGWDEFRLTGGARYYGSFRFSNENEFTGAWFQTGEDEYVTTVDGDDAVELIQDQENRQQPFFLYVAPIAPHNAQSFVPEDMVETQYQNFASQQLILQTPDLFEADVSDKPRHLRFTTPENWKQYMARLQISRVRAMKSVDDMVGRILQAVNSIGAADNTYIMLTSDNGFQMGHHNLQNKTDPYHRTTNVPLFVRGPGVPANRNASHLLAHIDICPTILDIAGAPIPSSVEAKSFFPVMRNPQNFSETQWQDGIMIENWAKKSNYGSKVLGTYVAYRRHHEIFVSWANGLYEYYNLEDDPYQLNNSFQDLTTSQKQAFKRSIRRFRTNRIDPITTLDSNFTTVHHSKRVRIRGFAEDDSGVFGVLLTVKSQETERFWNGSAWQDDWFGHYLPVRNPNQPITTWKYNSNITTQTQSGKDFLTFTYRSIDAEGTLAPTVSFHSNQIDSKAPIASFDDGIDRNNFTGTVNFRGLHFDANRVNQALLTIRRQGTGEYYNGTGFQDERFEIKTQLLENNRWQYNRQLPAGNYRAGIRAIDGVGNRQQPADSVRFTVQGG